MANYTSQHTGVQIDSGITKANSAIQPADLTSALGTKQDNLVSGTNIKSINSTTLLGTGNIDISKTSLGLANVDNTSDANKPISTATQTALDGKADSAHAHAIATTSTAGFMSAADKAKLDGFDPADGAGSPTLQGDPAPYVTQTKTYQITNYNSFSSYTVSASAGTVSLTGDTITFTAPTTAGSVSLTLTVDGQPTVFTVAVLKVDYIPVPTPTPANFGAPFEGGFYAGMIWNELVQSATSTTIGTDSKTFTVPSMNSTPIVYAGQQLEVRSRANPANKMVGNVTSVVGANLTINVTSIGGSGTFTDWSIMSRYRVIVAPKASGEHAGIALKNANTALPTACQTLTEGFAATHTMRASDTSTVYPAAHWARNLNIGGRTDWYIPARDELEMCWRNLKPTTTDNYVTANRPTAASFNYANNGSYGDTAATHGTNNNSSPTGAAYTTSVPGQTAATAFRTGGAEAYEFGSAYYWSSSDYNDSNAWFQYWNASSPGYQSKYGSGKASTYRVRAVRRSII